MSEPSWQDFYDLGKATLQARRPTARVEEGDVYDAIIAGTASCATAIVGYGAGKFRSVFLDGAVGDDLTDVCHDRGVDRDLGDEAIGYLTLTRISAAAGGGTISAGTRVATQPDVNGDFSTFVLDEDVVFGALDLTKTLVAATCSAVGKNGNVELSTITRFIDQPFDLTITVTNPQRFAGGVEIESDEDLRDRTRGFFLTQARGTIAAIEYGARQVPGVDRVTIVVDESGVVTVYIADADGGSNTALVTAVTVELENWRDAADVVYVTGGVIVSQDINVSLTVRTGVSATALIDRVRQAITNRMARLNPGETLYRDMISAAARDVDREAIVAVNVITPAANVAPAINELIRAGNINFS